MKRDLSKMTCIEDLRRVAQRKVPRMFYDYADSGSWTKALSRQQQRFSRHQFRQRVFVVNMENRSLATKELLGEGVEMPVAIAPTGLHRRAACRRRDFGRTRRRRSSACLSRSTMIDLFH